MLLLPWLASTITRRGSPTADTRSRAFETWEADGARTATERAHRIWKQLLAEYEQPAMDPGVAAAIEAFIARRKREIATAS